MDFILLKSPIVVLYPQNIKLSKRNSEESDESGTYVSDTSDNNDEEVEDSEVDDEYIAEPQILRYPARNRRPNVVPGAVSWDDVVLDGD